MTQANFTVSQDLLDAWQHGAASARWIQCRVARAGAKVSLSQLGPPEEPLAEAFESIRNAAEAALLAEPQSPACVFLLALTDGPAPAPPAAAAPSPTRGWCIVSYAPESLSAPVKMSLAAGRDALKRHLPAGPTPLHNYHCTEAAEVDFSAFQAWRDHSNREASMTAQERMMAQVTQESAASIRGVTRLAGMAGVPFKCGEPLTLALQQLANHSAAGGALLQIGIATTPKEGGGGVEEAFVVTHGPTYLLGGGSGHDSLEGHVTRLAGETPAEPRYYVVRLPCLGPPGLALLYHCPDAAPPRMRMLYSTGKKALVELLGGSHAAAGGRCELLYTGEATDGEEVKAHVAGMLAAAAAASSPAADGTAAHASAPSFLAEAADGAEESGGFSRPSRPGRPRAAAPPSAAK